MEKTGDLPEPPSDGAAAASPAAAPLAAKRNYPHPALFGLLIMPFGIVTGYCGVTLPRILSLQGETTTAIGAFQAFAAEPHSFKFLIEPAIDARWKRRSWFLAMIAIVAITLPIGVLFQYAAGGASLLGHHFAQLALLGGILFVANAAVATSSGAMTALIAVTLPKEKKGAAAGWAMAGNLGGYGVGGAIGLFLAQNLPTPIAAVCMGLLVCAFSAPALFIKEAPAPAHPIWIAIKRLVTDAWRTLKSRDGWTGLIICLSPVGAGGATGLFSDIAKTYRAGDTQVALVNGLFGGLVSALGCVIGGYIADKINRRLAYALAGGLTALCAIVMSMMTTTPTVYTVGCLAYSFANGVAYAAWAAFVLDLMGHEAGVATKHALFAAAANQATNYMLVVDSAAVDGHVPLVGFGPTAGLRADAIGTALGLVVLGGMLMLVRRMKKSDPPAVAAVT